MFLLLVVLLSTSNVGVAQNYANRQLALARICNSEAGFRAPYTNDCALIHEVLIHLPPSQEYLNTSRMRRYSGLTFDRTRTDTRRYIPWLTLSGREPRHWRAGNSVPWSTRRQAWILTLDLSGDILHGILKPPTCSYPVHHWGARWLNRTNLGWIRAECPNTLNQFWHVPQRRR